MTGEQPHKAVSRRSFLIALTGSALAASAGYQAVTAQTNTPHAAPRFPEAVPDKQWGILKYDQPVLTPTDRLFTARYAPDRTPHIDANLWRLTIDGLVESPCALSLADIHALPTLEDTRAMECISNPAGGAFIGNIRVQGADFAAISARIGIKSEATHVRFEAADGYTTAVTLKQMRQRGVMLAYAMNGEALTVERGFPLRLMIPGVYGQKMPRWITRMSFIDHEYLGYWEQRGLSNSAEVRTKAIIHVPTTGSEIVTGESIVIQGIAVAGTRAITSVEVQIDDGEWFPAVIAATESPYAWRQWYVRWNAPAPGVYRIGVRATDETGFVQHQEADRRLSATPNGTSAIHRISVYIT